LVGDDEDVVCAAGLAAGNGLLKQGRAAQLHEWLGEALARGRPKSGASSTRQDNGYQFHADTFLFSN